MVRDTWAGLSSCSAWSCWSLHETWHHISEWSNSWNWDNFKGVNKLPDTTLIKHPPVFLLTDLPHIYMLIFPMALSWSCCFFFFLNPTTLAGDCIQFHRYKYHLFDSQIYPCLLSRTRDLCTLWSTWQMSS
jgi:hypothetical protein